MLMCIIRNAYRAWPKPCRGILVLGVVAEDRLARLRVRKFPLRTAYGQLFEDCHPAYCYEQLMCGISYTVKFVNGSIFN